MFYEEKIINSVLHWRDTPEGEWTAYTAEQLTERLIGARYQRDALMAEINRLTGESQ